MVLIGRMGLAAIRAQGWRPRAVGGLTMGADPVAYAIAAASQGTDLEMDAFSVRKEAKAHGTGQHCWRRDCRANKRRGRGSLRCFLRRRNQFQHSNPVRPGVLELK